ncbi:hypothetical protein HY251_00045 [bacterium]|nr:hypothetical protein [bacterium]
MATRRRGSRRRIVAGALAVLVLVFSRAPLGADDAAFVKRKNEAIDKGVAWLKHAQLPDGSYDYTDRPFTMLPHMKHGCTALAAFALLKAGVTPTDPVIDRAFASIHKQKLEHVYSAGCILLAIEARANWEPPRQDEAPAPPPTPPPPTPGGTRQGEANPKGGPSVPQTPKGVRDPKDLDLAKKCVDFLIANQATNVWRYPYGKSEDTSAAQYALLGLDAGERLGLPVAKDVYKKAQEYFVSNQESDGPEVSPFIVPGADRSYAELRKVEKELREKIKKIDASFKGKKPGELNADGHTEEDELRAAAEAAGKTVCKPREPDKGKTLTKMRARGWCYAYGPKGTTSDPMDQDMAPWKKTISGSLTASAVACLFICKAHLEGTPDYEKGLKEPIDTALRDGAAWLAQNFTVSENPGRPVFHHYYYMYGLERAGILGLIPRFGEHDWYEEGSQMFLDQQDLGGCWEKREVGGTGGPVLDTCFALLFLARGTTPPVRVPTVTTTGGGGQ